MRLRRRHARGSGWMLAVEGRLTARDLSTPIELPEDPEELARCMADASWRLSHLYKIMVKGDDDDEGTILNFKPNRAQLRFISRLWHRNIILKARQLGFTTLICIVWLDHALFNTNQRCGIVAHDDAAALSIFRDKVKLAYDHMPATLRAKMPVASRNEHEILFAHNNSSVRVATSMRSGTIHRLLISEYGKICARWPHKAMEVQTGSLPAVPSTGITVIESTAEGMDGDFYKKTKAAIALEQLGKPLGVKDFRFHFYAWWMEPKYRVRAGDAVITRKHEEYFSDVANKVQAELGQRLVLTVEQKTWYVATLEGEFSGDEQVMWREYPSYPQEAFKVSLEGAYYANQLALARRQGRIGNVPYVEGIPVHTFWDLGLNDIQAIWFMQVVGVHHRFINYFEDSGEGVNHYARQCQTFAMEYGYTYGVHHIPHDGAARRVTMEKPETYEEMMRKAGFKNIRVVPRITHVTTGIDQTRAKFGQCWFDETNCSVGLAHLGNYRKEWDANRGLWKDTPLHSPASNAADAFRQYGQDFKNGGRAPAPPRKRSASWRVA
jgi:hypothetical protein